MSMTDLSPFLAQILLAALVSSLQQAVQHWFPWRMLLRRDLPRVAAYVIGTLAYLVPLTILFLWWEQATASVPPYLHLLAVWACVGSSGAAVILVRAADWFMDEMLQHQEEKELHHAAQKRS